MQVEAQLEFRGAKPGRGADIVAGRHESPGLGRGAAMVPRTGNRPMSDQKRPQMVT